MAATLALLAPLADAAEEGKKVIIGMLIVGFVFIGVIALGQLAEYARHRRHR